MSASPWFCLRPTCFTWSSCSRRIRTFSPGVGGKKEEHEHEGPQWSVARAIGSLFGASVLAAWMSEILVGAAEGTGKAMGMSRRSSALCFSLSSAARRKAAPAIAMARKNKMDLTVGIAMGSCIQIALFVAPVLVLPVLHRAASSGSVLQPRGNRHAVPGRADRHDGGGDGQSNWFKGVQLVTVYAIIAILFYFMPYRN